MARSGIESEGEADKRCRITMRMGTKEGRSRERKRMRTLLGLLSNRFLSKFELATVANDDRNLRAVFLIRRYVYDLRDDIFVSTDHPTEHHMFAWRMEDQSGNSNK